MPSAASAPDRPSPAAPVAAASPDPKAARPDPAGPGPAGTRWTVVTPVIEPPTGPEAEPGDPPPAARGRWRVAGVLARFLWLVGVVAGAAAVGLGWVPVLPVPDLVPLVGAVVVTSLFALGLAARTGGRALASGALALLLAGAAAVTDSPVMLSAAAVGTSAVAAILGVMATKRAARFPGVVREVVVATAVAAVGAFAAEAYGAEVSAERSGYLVLGISLLGALLLVYRLGAGLHGLGRRGLVMILGGVGLLTVTLAYTEALSRWGSPELIQTLDQSIAGLRDQIFAMPRPIEVLLGVPALAWGVSTRARRRQGWWVCAFGAAGLAVVSVALLDPTVPLAEAGLSLLYSLALGLIVGYAVIRADLFLTGPRGRRARRLEEAAAHRPEPGRMQPLL